MVGGIVGGLILAVLVGTLVADALGGSRLAQMAIALPIGGTAALVLLSKTPGVIFGMYLAIPFYKGGVDPWLPVDLTVTLAFATSVTAAPFVMRTVSGHLNRDQYKALMIWTIPMIVVAMGTLYTINPSSATGTAARMVLLVFVPGLAGFALAQSQRHRMQVILTLGAFGLASTAHGLATMGALGEWDRVEALGANTLQTALSGLMVPLLALCLARGRSATWRLGATAVSAPAMFVVLGTGSRGPLVMAIITVVVIWLCQSFSGRRLVIRLIAVIAATALFLTVQIPRLIIDALPTYAGGRLLSLQTNIKGSIVGSETKFDASEQTRLGLWDLAWTKFRQRPITGWGTDAFGVMSEVASYPHNLILQLLVEYGLLGTIPLSAVFIVGLTRLGWRNLDPSSVAVVAVFLFALLVSMTSYDLVENRLLWGSLAMVLALPRGGARASLPSEPKTGMQGMGFRA
jgi:O-antigen ligase